MSNEVAESNADQDLGSGGEMLLPDLTDSSNTVRHLVVGAGKDGNIYLVDRDSMGKFNANSNNIYQTLSGALPGGIWSTPAYFNGTVYYGEVSGTLKAFAISSAKLVAAPQSQTATQFTFPGTAPSVSANGTANGIVWAHENTSPAVLHAYDATNLAHELYNSNQAAGKSGSLRRRQQIHHADGGRRQGIRGHHQFGGGFRLIALKPSFTASPRFPRRSFVRAAVDPESAASH